MAQLHLCREGGKRDRKKDKQDSVPLTLSLSASVFALAPLISAHRQTIREGEERERERKKSKAISL